MKKFVLSMICLASLCVLAGCEKRTPAEEAMRRIKIDCNAPAPEYVMTLQEEIEQIKVEKATLEYLSQPKQVMFDYVGYLKKSTENVSEMDSAIFIHKNVYERLVSDSGNLVDLYVQAIESRYGKKVYVQKFPAIDAAPEGIRGMVTYLYDKYWNGENFIGGVILVGQWHTAGWTCTHTRSDGSTYVTSGPLWEFYTDLDPGEFTVDESDPAIQGLFSTYNRVWRKTDYIHNNVAITDGVNYAFGDEIWAVAWRATGIHKPKIGTEDGEEIVQLSRFISKCLAFHNKETPYFHNGGSLDFDKVIGICHNDYGANCSIPCSDPNLGCTGKKLDDYKPGWYFNILPPTGYGFVKNYMKTGAKYFIFDVWTHSGPMGFWPDQFGVYSPDIFNNAEEGCGFLYTPIFGCSSGQFLYSESVGGYNYAVSLISGKSIGLSSVGTPWSIGFGWPFKLITYDGILANELFLAESYVITSSEALYRDKRWPQNGVVEKSISPYIYFGDPYVKVPGGFPN